MANMRECVTAVFPTEQLDVAFELPCWKMSMEYSLGKYFTLLEAVQEEKFM